MVRTDAEISPETLAAMEGRIAECTRVILPEDPMDVVVGGSVELVIGRIGADGDGNDLVTWLFRPI